MNQTAQLTGRVSHIGEADIHKLLQGDFANACSVRIMPEMKISFDGRRLFANASAKKLLERLGVKDLEAKFFNGKYPHILKPGVNEDFEVNSGLFVFCFSAVAFDEAEYIGLYCYRIIKKEVYQ